MCSAIAFSVDLVLAGQDVLLNGPLMYAVFLSLPHSATLACAGKAHEPKARFWL
jgi:hypothetical protein